MKIHIRKSDKLFSQYIRSKAKWRCERCGKQHEKGSSGLHASHYWGRSKESVRFDERNVHAICFGCHNFFHAYPEKHREWMIQKIGEKEFKKLMVQAHCYKKRDDVFDEIYCQKLLNPDKRGEITKDGTKVMKNKAKKERRVMTCANCGGKGHTRRKCPN